MTAAAEDEEEDDKIPVGLRLIDEEEGIPVASKVDVVPITLRLGTSKIGLMIENSRMLLGGCTHQVTGAALFCGMYGGCHVFNGDGCCHCQSYGLGRTAETIATYKDLLISKSGVYLTCILISGIDLSIQPRKNKDPRFQ